MLAPALSVVICTHNPREDYLQRVLTALREQTLPNESWELLLVDNASSKRVAMGLQLAWHPKSRVLREEKLGLANARLAGIRETSGEVVVFVDDDNVLSPCYLENVLALDHGYPMIGAWSGRVIPEFERPPAPELGPYLNCLCLRDFERNSWGNRFDLANAPWGAGLCVRRSICSRYLEKAQASAITSWLDRRGAKLGNFGDVDLAMLSLEAGLGTGLFAELVVTHLIPSARLSMDYILRLIQDSSASEYVYLRYVGVQPDAAVCRVDRLVAWYKRLRTSRTGRLFQRARDAGLAQGRQLWQTLVEQK
jgi:glycosyltransferase involved in cell wall biosynthesis